MTEPKKTDDQEAVDLTTEEDETLEDDKKLTSDTDDSTDKDKSGDTDTDTSDDDESDDDTDTETPADDISKVMTELGLDKTYADAEAALRAVPEQMKALTRAHTDSAEMRRLLTELAKSRTEGPAEKKSDLPSNEELIEEFNVDPIATFDKMAKSRGYVRGEDLGQLTSEVRNTAITVGRNNLAQGVESLKGLENVAPLLKVGQTPEPGFNAVWDAMDAAYQQRPALHSLSQADVMPILHDLVQGANGGATDDAGDDKPGVKKVSLSKKAGASTTGSGGKGAGLLEDGTPDFTLPKWTDEKIKAWMIKHEMYG